MYGIKKTAHYFKKEFNKCMENLRKQNQSEILEIKSSLNKKIQGKATLQTRTNGRQNLRRQNRY
jgi:hypothetical protein